MKILDIMDWCHSMFPHFEEDDEGGLRGEAGIKGREWHKEDKDWEDKIGRVEKHHMGKLESLHKKIEIG